MRGWLQGYNAQTAINEQQIVVAAAEITVDSPDFGHLEPILTAARRELDAAGVANVPEVVVADAGYWHQDQVERIVADGIQVLIPPDSSRPRDPQPPEAPQAPARDRGRLTAPRARRGRARPHRPEPPHYRPGRTYATASRETSSRNTEQGNRTGAPR
jgi:hypothetical protein